MLSSSSTRIRKRKQRDETAQRQLVPTEHSEASMFAPPSKKAKSAYDRAVRMALRDLTRAQINAILAGAPFAVRDALLPDPVSLDEYVEYACLQATSATLQATMAMIFASTKQLGAHAVAGRFATHLLKLLGGASPPAASKTRARAVLRGEQPLSSLWSDPWLVQVGSSHESVEQLLDAQALPYILRAVMPRMLKCAGREQFRLLRAQLADEPALWTRYVAQADIADKWWPRDWLRRLFQERPACASLPAALRAHAPLCSSARLWKCHVALWASASLQRPKPGRPDARMTAPFRSVRS